MKPSFLVSTLALAAAAAAVFLAPTSCAFADQSDREKPAQILYERSTVDDLNQIKYFSGNVLVTKGTIVIHADELVVKTDPEGYQSSTAISTGPNPVTFRQHRDGPGDQYIDGHAKRIEYGGKTDTVKLFDHAVVRRIQQGVEPDESRGDTIEYNSDTQHYVITGGPSNVTSGGSDARARTILQPAKTPPAPPAAPLKLQNSPATSKPTDE